LRWVTSTSPRQNSHSSAILAAVQFQPQLPVRRGGVGLQLGGGQRALLRNLGADPVDEVGMLARQPGHPAPRVPVGHPPAQVGVQPQRQQGRLVAPVFEQLPGAAVGHGVEQLGAVGTEAAVAGQVVGAPQDVDGVDLQQAGAAEHAAQVAAVGRAAGWRVGEALRGQRDPPRLGGGDRVHHP